MTGDESSPAQESRLAVFGLDEFDERVYLRILSQPWVPRTLLTELLGAQEEVLTRSLDKLAALGLIRSMTMDGDRLIGNRPEAAFSALAYRKLAELEEARVSGDILSDIHRNRAALTPRAPLADVVHVYPEAGQPPVSGMHRIFIRLMAEAKSEIVGFDGEKGTGPLDPEEIEDEAPVLRRGVSVRALYSAEQLLVPGRLQNLRALAELGERSRVSWHLPRLMIVFDRRLALLPPISRDPMNNFSAVLVHSPTLITLILWLFEHQWQLATPTPVGVVSGREAEAEAEAADALEGNDESASRQLAILLATGLKDEAVAAVLGLSVKTTRRRITALLAELGVGTRFEAGAEAARRGWI